jgi:hypothetical protein
VKATSSDENTISGVGLVEVLPAEHEKDENKEKED